MKVEEKNQYGRHCTSCGAMMIRSVAHQENSYDEATGEAKTKIHYQWKCPNDPFYNVFECSEATWSIGFWFLVGVLAVCLAVLFFYLFV